MEKDNSINSLVSRYKSSINIPNVKIVDYWDGDLCSIGLERDNKLAYISTYNYLSTNVGRFDYDFEETTSDKIRIVIKSNRCVSEQELFEDLRMFFK